MAPSRGRYDHEKWVRQQAREQERQARADAAETRAVERERKAADLAAGKARAQRLNEEIASTVATLESILARGLDRDPRVDLRALKRRDPAPVLDLDGRGEPVPAPEWSDLPEPGPVAGWFGGRARHERRVAAAREDFEQAVRDHRNAERLRREWVEQQRARHEQSVRAHRDGLARHNARVDALVAGVSVRDRVGVQDYLELVLGRTRLPDAVPRQAEVAYNPQGEQAVVRFELPTVEVVPEVAVYTYVASTATLREKARPAAQIAQLYRSMVSQIGLLYMRDLFEADPDLDNVELSGHVHSVSPATGQREYPCLITFAVDREAFARLNLRDVTPHQCLSHLNALVSHHPHLVEAVTPVRDFELARFAFTVSVDVVADLDSRVDLTTITPVEFEHFVRQLLEAHRAGR